MISWMFFSNSPYKWCGFTPSLIGYDISFNWSIFFQSLESGVSFQWNIQDLQVSLNQIFLSLALGICFGGLHWILGNSKFWQFLLQCCLEWICLCGLHHSKDLHTSYDIPISNTHRINYTLLNWYISRFNLKMSLFW